MMDQKKDSQIPPFGQLPTNLVEALGGTPLTHLVPAQHLSSLISLRGPRVPPPGLFDLPPSTQSSQMEEALKALKSDLSMDFLSDNIRFQDTKESLVGPKDFETNLSMLECLSPMAKELILDQRLVELAHDRKPDIISVTSPVEHPSTIAKSANGNPKLPQQHKHKIQSQDSESSISIKKRKSDIDIHYSQMEGISLAKLSDLIIRKIGLTDEEAEYEHSDLWTEWPNTSHYLSLGALAEIEDHLSKLIVSCLADSISLEVLSRIQSLAMKTLKSANEMDWKEMATSDRDIGLSYAENVLKAAPLVMMILNSEREEKELHRDTYLLQVISFIYTFFEDYVIKILSQEGVQSKGLIPLLGLISRILTQLTQYIPGHQIDDTTITKLEYLTIMIVFFQCDKSLLFFKMESATTLLTIFHSKRSQRSFIIDEILNNFDSLPTHKTYSRQVRTSRGVNIQMFTYILVNMVESINISNVDLPFILPSNFPEPNSTELQELKSDLYNFANSLHELKADCLEWLNVICSALVTKLQKNCSVTTKAQFEILVTDLLNIVQYPEYPGTETVLTALTGVLVSLSSDQQPISAGSYFLEMVGLIGSTMLDIKGTNDITQPLDTLMLPKERTNIYRYLHSSGKDSALHYSSDFFLLNWLISVTQKLKLLTDEKTIERFTHLYYSILKCHYHATYTTPLSCKDQKLSNEDITNEYRHVLCQSDFIGMYQNFLNHLLATIDHPSIKTRTRSLKNLALLINKDPKFMTLPRVMHTISSRIHDQSPLVRSAVLDILDQYLIKRPGQIRDIYQIVLLTNDKSVGTRLKSLKIAKRLYFTSTDLEVKINIIEKIFKRLEDDEENVVELAESILLEALFSNVPLDLQNPIELRNQVMSLIQIIVAMITKSEKSWELFETFFFSKIIKKTELNLKVHDHILNVVERLTHELFAFVIENVDSEVSLSPKLGLLSIIAMSERPFIVQEQLLSLQTYLTSDVNPGSDIMLYSLVILRHTLTNTVSMKPQFLDDCEASLLKRLTKLNSKELSQAIPSLWTISTIKNDSTKLANAAATCFVLLKPFIATAQKGEFVKFDSRCARLIFLIGNFGEYCNFEQDRAIFLGKRLALRENESVLSFVVKHLLLFSNITVESQIRRIAVKNLIFVCSTHPKLFLNEKILQIFDAEFASDRLEFQEVIIQGLLEFLQIEEKNSIQSSETSHKGLDVAVFHGDAKTFQNDGICASLVQRFMRPILRLCLIQDGGVSFLAVKYLKFIIIMGFCNPRICTPTVIALQASPISYIRNTGVDLFKTLFEKYESLVDSSYIQGFKEAVDFRSRLTKNILDQSFSFFPKFYQIIEDSRSSKKKLFSQLVKSLKFDVESMETENCKPLYDYVLFVSMNLADCEFNAYEEVFTLIDGIETIFSDQSVSLQKLIKSTMVDNEHVDDLKVGYFAAILISYHRLLAGLRATYKVFENRDRSDLKALRPKVTDKHIIKLVKFDPSNDNIDMLVTTFQSIL